MSEWKSIVLRELSQSSLINIRTGPFGSQLHQTDYVEDGIPVIMPKDISDWKVLTNSIARTSKKMVDMLKRHRVEVGDIVYGRRGDIGRHALITSAEAGWLCGTGCIRLRLDNKAPITSDFLSMFLRLPAVIDGIYNQAVGSTMPNLNTSIIENIEVFFPSIAMQKKLVTIMFNYDQLIENNNYRISILEEMAQKLYREWFMHFRFPGHENVQMVESEIGLIPEGWEVRRVTTITKFIKGKKAKKISAGNSSDSVKSILLDAISSGQYEFVSPVKMVLVNENDIIMVMDGASSGKVIIGECGALGSTLAKVETSSIYKILLYMHLSVQEKSIMDNNTGSAIPHANKDFISRMPILIPKTSVLERFNGLVQPLLSEIYMLKVKNSLLHRTRDLLLPHLISGDIDVSNLDIQIRRSSL